MEKITDLIAKEEVVEITRQLLRCPSVNPPGDVSRCAEVIGQMLDSYGIPYEKVENKPGVANVVARLKGQAGGKTLLLNGHFDVVPPGLNWTVDPFGGEVSGGNIYGRGAADMKSGIAAIIAAMAAVRRSGYRFRGEIVFTAIADEETGSINGTLHLIEKGIIKADHAIVTEPTDLRIENGQRGLRWVEIVVKGKAAHGGRPHLGVNAVAHAARIVGEIERIKYDLEQANFEVGTPSISVTMIEGGVKVNIIPDQCKISLDRRMIPGETTTTVTAEIEEVLHRVQSPGVTTEINFLPARWDPYVISDQEPVVSALREAYVSELGHEPEIRGKAACTDASHIYHYTGIPTVIFGPGDGRFSHTADEHADIEKIVQAARILAVAGVKLCGE